MSPVPKVSHPPSKVMVRVRGPVQSGKTSLLARLSNRAQEKGIETLWFDPDPTGMINPQSQ